MHDLESTLANMASWIGDGLFDRSLGKHYLKAVQDADGPRDVAEVTTAVENWARRELDQVIPQPSGKWVLLAQPKTRDPVTGLRFGHLLQPLDVNKAPEEHLRQVPGIGAATARRIVASRSEAGPFVDLRDLVEWQCCSAESLALARPYLSLAEAHAVRSGKKSSFERLVRIRHALDQSDEVDLESFALETFKSALQSLHPERYWPVGHALRKPIAKAAENGAQRLREWQNEPLPAEVAALDSQQYLRLVQRLFDKAGERILVQIPFSNLLHHHALKGMLDALVAAARRKVDVRLLHEPCDFDDFAYLDAQGVKCRAGKAEGRIHSRVVLVDQEYIICGSNSWSATSAYHSEEIAIFARSRELAILQVNRFEKLWARSGTKEAL